MVAICFGRRTFVEFKPRLEKILKDVVLLSEVADLAEEAEKLQSDREHLGGNIGGSSNEYGAIGPDRRNNRATSKMLAGSVTWEDESSRSLGDPDALSPVQTGQKVPDPPRALERTSSGNSSLSRSGSGHLNIRNLLDRWEEPINKLEKTSDASIHDILRFRRALAFMDEDRPFGDSFGSATNRDECIESANRVYIRLLNLTPGITTLSNDVLVMLAQEEDGTINTSKQAAMRRLFRPDRLDQIPKLAFIQSCDTLYRKLRYFRASVGNASVIGMIHRLLMSFVVSIRCPLTDLLA
jgi:hypothetical protein